MIKVTLGYKLPANYVLYTVRPRDKNDINKLNLHNVLTYDVKSGAFCCVATGFHWFDQRKAAEIAPATVRLFLTGHVIWKLHEQTMTTCQRSSCEN